MLCSVSLKKQQQQLRKPVEVEEKEVAGQRKVAEQYLKFISIRNTGKILQT